MCDAVGRATLVRDGASGARPRDSSVYPTLPDVPLPIATRTQSSYSNCGLRTA